MTKLPQKHAKHQLTASSFQKTSLLKIPNSTVLILRVFSKALISKSSAKAHNSEYICIYFAFTF